MPLRTLIIANGVMLLFLGLFMALSFHGLSSSNLVERMQEQGLVKQAS